MHTEHPRIGVGRGGAVSYFRQEEELMNRAGQSRRAFAAVFSLAIALACIAASRGITRVSTGTVAAEPQSALWSTGPPNDAEREEEKKLDDLVPLSMGAAGSRSAHLMDDEKYPPIMAPPKAEEVRVGSLRPGGLGLWLGRGTVADNNVWSQNYMDEKTNEFYGQLSHSEHAWHFSTADEGPGSIYYNVLAHWKAHDPMGRHPLRGPSDEAEMGNSTKEMGNATVSEGQDGRGYPGWMQGPHLVDSEEAVQISPSAATLAASIEAEAGTKLSRWERKRGEHSAPKTAPKTGEGRQVQPEKPTLAFKKKHEPGSSLVSADVNQEADALARQLARQIRNRARFVPKSQRPRLSPPASP